MSTSSQTLVHQAEGKTKKIWRIHKNGVATNLVVVESKDDITAGDGAKHDMLPGKGRHATTTTINCFKLLESAGVKTHYVHKRAVDAFVALNVDMVPLEVVVRGTATGSYLRRNPDIPDGARLDPPVVEFFEKDDANHDPYIAFSPDEQMVVRYQPGIPLSQGLIGSEPWAASRFAGLSLIDLFKMRDLALEAFAVLQEAWSRSDAILVDLKVEFGTVQGTNQIVLADVVDNDSWRIWPGGDKSRMLDKQVYRDLKSDDPEVKAAAMAIIAANYAKVAELTDRFFS